MKTIVEEVSGFKGAVKGMRYPLNSDSKTDSFDGPDGFVVGDNDKDLMLRLCVAGPAHRKVLRCIHIGLTANMPFTWWKHFDTHKVGTTAISRSTMHKGVGNRLLTKEDFQVDQWNEEQESTLAVINELQRQIFDAEAAGDRDAKRRLWRRLIDALPMSLLQERYVDMNYENALSVLHLRFNVEKLSTEWNFFGQALIDGCPMLGDIYNATLHKRQMTTEEFDALRRK